VAVTSKGPPPNIQPQDLWDQITTMPRPYRIAPFPRKNAKGEPIGEIAFVVLTELETQQVTAQSEAWVRKLLKEGQGVPANNEPRTGYEILFETRSSCETLMRACRKPTDLGQPFFPAVDHIAKHLTTDEIAALLLSYNRIRSEVGPLISELTQAEMDAWIEILGRGAAVDPLDYWPTASVKRLAVYMAVRLRNSSTGTSSGGTASDVDISSL